MANDRMYLKCKGCGEKFCLGKTYLDGYFIYNEETFGKKLCEFYDKHKDCVEPEMFGQKIQTYELVYDSDVYDTGATNEDEQRILDKGEICGMLSEIIKED